VYDLWPMSILRRIVVAVLLAVWFCPPARAEPPPVVQAGGVTKGEIQQLAQREQQARQLERFQGGARISISTSAIIIILLLIIIIIILL
jgi:hypothetical protein